MKKKRSLFASQQGKNTKEKIPQRPASTTRRAALRAAASRVPFREAPEAPKEAPGTTLYPANPKGPLAIDDNAARAERWRALAEPKMAWLGFTGFSKAKRPEMTPLLVVSFWCSSHFLCGAKR